MKQELQIIKRDYIFCFPDGREVKLNELSDKDFNQNEENEKTEKIYQVMQQS